MGGELAEWEGCLPDQALEEQEEEAFTGPRPGGQASRAAGIASVQVPRRRRLQVHAVIREQEDAHAA